MKKEKDFMLFANITGHWNFALLNEDPLTFVYSVKGENGQRFTGKDYNHLQKLRSQLGKMGIESGIYEFFEREKQE
jgi:hypothetical protein